MHRVALDAHVHLHDKADAFRLLCAAHDRVKALAGADCLPVFMLAEQQGCDMFDALRARGEPTQERESLWLRHGSAGMLLLAGRQVVSAEKLEILAQATDARFSDGTPADRLIADMLDAGAVVTLPWGVGKWMGRRGEIVDALLAGPEGARLHVGDNGGRPGFWRVSQFGARLVLRGSDPLPLRGDATRIGSFGTLLDGMPSRSHPARDIRRMIQSARADAAGFGRLASPIRFVSNQLRLRLAS